MTVAVTPLSVVFNLLTPARKAGLNAQLLRAASDTFRNKDEKVWPEIEKLLKSGADMNVADANGDTVLSLLCKNRQAEAAQHLLENGAIFTTTGKDDMTPFLHASEAGSPALLRAFIARGADTTQQTPKGENALHMLMSASQGGPGHTPERDKERQESLRLLLETGLKLGDFLRMRLYNHLPALLPAVPELDGVYRLEQACDKKDAEEARSLLAQGVHPDAPVKFGGRSALGLAACHGLLDVMDDAIAAGGGLNLASGPSRLPPLMMAISGNQKEAFIKLLDAGADFDAAHNGSTLIQYTRDHRRDMLPAVVEALHERTQHRLSLGEDIKVRTIRLKPKDGGP